MANLMLAGRCNRACSYCFAGRSMARTPELADESLWRRFVPWLERSGIDALRLVGGEPTLHPRFAEVVRAGVEAGRNILLFTNGLMPDSALDALTRLPEERLRVVMNVQSPDERAPDELQRQRRVVEALPDRVQLGFNVHRLPLEMDFLLDLVEELPLGRWIRVGLALPTLRGGNRSLPVRRYPVVGRSLARFARSAAAAGASLELDCGFVRCMFDEDALAALEQACLRFVCDPTLDVTTGGDLVHCFALDSLMARPFDPSEPADAVRADFRAALAPWRMAGIYPECSACPWKGTACSGGCLAATIRRFRHTPFVAPWPGDGPGR